VVRILYFADLEHAVDDPERIGRVTRLVETLRDPATLVLGGGDNTAPGVLPMRDDRYAAIPFFEAIEPDADILGNHEFDRSLEATAALCRQSPQPWLCANLATDEDPTAAFAEAAEIEPWTVLEAGDERVGVFGVAAPDTDEISPRARNLTFTDPVPAAREAVTALRSVGVDRIVGISHVGDDEPLAAALDVPVVLGGHHHDTREDVVDGTLLLRPGAVGRRIAEVTTDGDGPASVTWHRTAAADPDPDVVGTYRSRLADLGLDEVVATVDQPISRDAKNGESAIGNFVADALLRAADADVALMPGGSVRDDTKPLEGDLTVADLYSLVPFDNEILAVEVPGDRLLDALREASGSHRDLSSPRRWYGQVANAEVVWDHEADAFERVLVDGDPVESDRTYTLGTIDYAIRPAGLFPSLDPSLPARGVGSIQDALVTQARADGIPTQPDGRIERRNLPTP
jgi:2',3'-cyclic-nucleotide 2'-phosphodiesterase (5'-nucleotidase family)